MTNNTEFIPPRGGQMQVHLKARDANGELYFEHSVPIDPVKLIEVSRTREQLAREKGRVFTEGAVPFFGTEMLKAAQEGRDDEVHQHAINAAMGAWLSASIFDGLTAAEFVHSNLHFTFLANGAVKFDRIRIG